MEERNGLESLQRWRRVAPLVGAATAGAAVLGLASTWSGYGCSIYDPSLLLPAVDSGTRADAVVVDAGSDARDARPGEDAGPSACPEVFPPAMPATDDPSDASDQSFVVALHTINVGLGDAGTLGLGYDLDLVYTGCEGGPESCKDPALALGNAHPDTPGGRDDSAGALLSTLASVDPTQFNATAISQRLQDGSYTVLFQVLHYNGQPNDAKVTVALYASDGVASDAGAQWNGNDSWSVDETFLINGDAAPFLPNHIDGNAYVANGTLVMHLSFPISIGTGATGSFTITLSAGIITGTVTPTAGTYSLQAGQIAGRWNVSDLLTAAQSVSIGGKTACPGTSYYVLLKNEACQYADIVTDPTKDNTGATCDALSFGVGFTADPAVLGGPATRSSTVSSCEGGPVVDNCGP